MAARLPAWTAKLAVRFLVVLGLLHVVFLCGAFVGLDAFLERLFEDTARVEAADLGRIIKSALRQQMMRAPELTVDATLADLAANESVRGIWIVDKKGRVAHATDTRVVGKVLDRYRDATCVACHSTASAAQARTWFATDASRQPVIRHVETIENDGACRQCHDPAVRLNGIVVVERSTGVFHLALSTIRRRLVGTAGLTMFALLAATLLLARAHVVRPVERLLAGARQFGEGNLEHRIAVRGRGEIADLGAAFNVMAADLGRSIDEVRTKTAELTIVYSILGRVTKSIHLTELQVVVLQTFLDVLETDLALLVSRFHDDDELELLSLRRGMARVQTVRAKSGELTLPCDVPAEFVAAWQRGDPVEPFVAPGSRVVALPIAGSKTRALLVVERNRAFLPAEANLNLLKVIAQHAAVAYDNAYLYTLAVTDPLTRLLTVRLFHDRLDEHVASWQCDGKGFALLMIDLDHFKQVNDAHGHPAGDEVLKAASAAIKGVIRLTDTAYRYGGEEFCVLLPGASAAKAAEIAERLRTRVERTIVALHGGAELRVTASLGVAVCPDDGATARDLLAAADAAMYRAKRGGRNRVCTAGRASRFA
jgi:diguanylate cyclase (GGDEF)-like protein